MKNCIPGSNNPGTNYPVLHVIVRKGHAEPKKKSSFSFWNIISVNHKEIIAHRKLSHRATIAIEYIKRLMRRENIKKSMIFPCHRQIFMTRDNFFALHFSLKQNA